MSGTTTLLMRLRLVELTVLTLISMAGWAIAEDHPIAAPTVAPTSTDIAAAPFPAAGTTAGTPAAPVLPGPPSTPPAGVTPPPTTVPAPTANVVTAENPVDNETNRSTAVALNYCRASFHRIRKEPTRVVLNQEQEKILNNLNLDAVDDPEVIQLYTAVLDEINQVGVADYERNLYREMHKNTIQKKVAWDVLALGADVATAQVGTAIRNGANSWWDYRSMGIQREQDLLKIEKTRISSVVAKSSLFMDTFWKLAQKKKIPDKWLVRGNDLDALELAMREPNPEVRLRVLRRMEDFMQCYPPYWYYTGRTQQEQGLLAEAVQTYQRLERLGQGHFRKDDMLATALANEAAIEDYNGQSVAIQTADRAMNYSRDVWEANLICARVMERNSQTVQAEDAILCNLDTSLERQNSQVFLVSLYQKTGEKTKLSQVLSNPQTVAELPAPLLLRCAATLGEKETPSTVIPAIMASLDAQPQFQFGKDELVVRVSSAWQLHLAAMQVYYDDESLGKPQITALNGQHQLKFSGRDDWGAPFEAPSKDLAFRVLFTYPDQTTVQLTLRPDPNSKATVASRPLFSRTASGVSTSGTMRIADIQIGQDRIALGSQGKTVIPTSNPTRVETAKPAFPTREKSTEEETLPAIDATSGGLRTSSLEWDD